MQQKIIDVLDTAEYVEVIGKVRTGRTCRYVWRPFTDPEKHDEV